jgi:hypothetical protein
MSQAYFDVIILGDSLAARIAGTLLAKGGCRVLSFQEPSEFPAVWLHSSLHLERLLERLDGRSSFSPPASFQVLTADSRLEFLQPSTLEGELRREFAGGYEEVSGLLNHLQSLGHRLEEALWESGGLPLLGISSRLRFAHRRLRRGLTRRALRKPFESILTGLHHEPARRALSALFAGLSMTPVDRLSVSEAALLWNSAVRAEGVSPDRLEKLLTRRYEQFNGRTEKLSGLQSLQLEGSRLSGAVLKEGGRYGARYFLIGSPAGWNLLQKPLKIAFRSHFSRLRFCTSPLRGGISPMFAERVIPDASFPVRFDFSSSGEEIIATVECTTGSPPPENLRNTLGNILKPLFPFASYQLEPSGEPESIPDGAGRAKQSFPGATSSLRLQKNLFICHGPGVLPSLGAAGDVITGLTVADHLLRSLKKRK